MHDPERIRLFAERLHLHRKRLGLSQDALAERLGCAQDTISKWERAKASAAVDDLLALCETFGVSADYLTGRASHESGLPVGMFIVDLDAAEAKQDGETWSVQIPQRPAIMSHTDVQRIHRDGIKKVRRKR